jgi:hypothetical protein
LLDAEHRGNHVGQRHGITQWAELAQPHPVAIAGKGLRGGLHRKPGLAHTTDADECDDAAVVDGLENFGDIVIASDEGGELQRKVGRERVEGSQERELAAQPRMHHLEHVLGLTEVA